MSYKLNDEVVFDDPFMGDITLKLIHIEDYMTYPNAIHYWYHKKFGIFIDNTGQATDTNNMINIKKEVVEKLAKSMFHEDTGIRI